MNEFDNVNPSNYYILSYRWSYYADGVCGRNTNHGVWVNEDDQGYPDRVDAQEIVKRMKKEDREAMKYYSKSGHIGSKGTQGGTYKIVKGSRFLKALDKFADDIFVPTYFFKRIKAKMI